MPRRGGEDASSTLRIDSVSKGSSGSAIVAAGAFSFVVDPSLLEDLGLGHDRLHPGSELDEAETLALRLGSEAFEAEKRALALLARAEQSGFMLRIKLEQRGFGAKAVSLALERLERSSLLDDRRFARAWVASRLGHSGSRAEGPASLVAALRERGIDAGIASQAVADVLDPSAQPEARAEALAAAAAKEIKRSRGDKSELRRRLRHLGFLYEEISDFIETYEP